MSDVIINPKLTPSDIIELRKRASKRDNRKNSNGTGVLTEICDVSKVSVHNWVSGKRTPGDIYVAKMVGELGAPSRFDGDVATYIHSDEGSTLAFTIIGGSDEVIRKFESIRSQVKA